MNRLVSFLNPFITADQKSLDHEDLLADIVLLAEYLIECDDL